MAEPQETDKKPRGWLSGGQKRAPMAGARRAIIGLRWVLMLVTLVFAAYILTTYSLYTVPGEYDLREAAPLRPDVEKGDTLLLQNFNFGRTPRLHDIVAYRQPGSGRDAAASLIGRIAGMPGEKLERVGPTMRVGGRDPMSIGFDIGPQAALNDGDMIPEGKYLVLVDTDAEVYPDSRRLGFIAREDITQRVGMNLATWFGRKQK